MTRPPVVSVRDANSVTATWPAWENPPDMGDGPVKGYFLYYKTVEDKVWKSERADNREAMIAGLQQGREYQFKVVPIHQQGYVGVASPILNASTCDGRLWLGTRCIAGSL